MGCYLSLLKLLQRLPRTQSITLSSSSLQESLRLCSEISKHRDTHVSRWKHSGIGCRQAEREVLLKIKDDLKDPSGRLASWEIGNVTDCCSWYGVSCNNSTGHVLELHLRSLSSDKQSSGFMNDYYDSYSHYRDNALEDYKGSFSGGKMSPFLLNLTHLRYLDLSNNEFERIQIPKFLGSMESLIHLNLSNAGFGGPIPPQLGNLTNLLYLNLNSKYDITYISNEKLQWISGLHSLEFHFFFNE